jgi:pimeloyl-ACP methyl ester carboxylesterase
MGQPSPGELADWWTLMATNDGPAVTPRLAGYVGERRRQRDRWVRAMQTTRVPLRCVVGADDPISGRHLAARYRQLVPSPDVVLLERTGHYPQVERPAAVVAALDAFFTERALA